MAIKDIDTDFTLGLICKIYKRRNHTELLKAIPFLVSVLNFGFRTGFLSENQKYSIFEIYAMYESEKSVYKTKKVLKTSNS